MLEKVLENWLIKSSERGYQTALCQYLLACGYELLHSTRHCAMEMGKDVIARKDGILHVFQLKSLHGKQLTQSQWRDEVSKQATTLIYTDVVFPGLPPGPQQRRAYLVVTGTISEEVQREIDDTNKAAQGRQCPALEVWTLGILVSKFSKKLSSVAPTSPQAMSQWLKLFLADGAAPLDKNGLFHLFEMTLGFDEEWSTTKIKEAISAVPILVSTSLANAYSVGNHSAIIDGWAMYGVHAASRALKAGLTGKDIRADLQISAMSQTPLGRIA